MKSASKSFFSFLSFCQQVLYLLQCGHIRCNSSCICAGAIEKCTQRPDQYLTPLTSLLQHSDLHKATSLHLASNHSAVFTEVVSKSPGFCIHLPVQHSLPESRLFSTTALAPKNEAGPDISLLSPLLQSQWDHPKNAHLGSVVIKPQANIKVWWTCDQCPDGHPHKWQTTPNHRSGRRRRQGSGCPFCANSKVCQHNSLPTKAPHLVPEWSEENERSPHYFTIGSGRKALWRCKCGCEWEATISLRTGLGSGCPDCAADKRRRNWKRHPTLTESQHEMLQLWDWDMNEQAGLDPSKLRCGSRRKVHWLCDKCPASQPHRWQAAVNHMYRSTSRGTSGCPCCQGLQACKCNSLQSLFPMVAAEWDYERNQGTPADITAYSHKKVWWHNSHRGHFKARIDHRTQNLQIADCVGKTTARAGPCGVSTMWPMWCKHHVAPVKLLAALSSYISCYTHAWQPCHEPICLMCKANAKLNTDAYLVEASLVCQAEANVEHCEQHEIGLVIVCSCNFDTVSMFGDCWTSNSIRFNNQLLRWSCLLRCDACELTSSLCTSWVSS